MLVFPIFVVVVSTITGLLSWVLPGWLTLFLGAALFAAGAALFLKAHWDSKKPAGIPEFAMNELFKHKRSGKRPEQCVQAVIDDLVRPENQDLADSLAEECAGSSSKDEDEAGIFRRFAIAFTYRLSGLTTVKEIAEPLVMAARDSYNRHLRQWEKENSSGAKAGARPVEWEQLDGLLQEHHGFLEALGDIERWVYWGALGVFFGFWLVLKWSWLHALLLQGAVIAVLVVLSLSVARYRVRATARNICRLFPPRTPRLDIALRRMSELDGKEVQLISDVLKETQSLSQRS